ncbi:hypothetical protein ACFL6T_05435, partial [Candidatus Zixiibacteriota bacterium]
MVGIVDVYQIPGGSIVRQFFRHFLCLSLVLALFGLQPVDISAQGTTGGIRGRVTDATTGDPLASVNVFVLETDGTATTM